MWCNMIMKTMNKYSIIAVMLLHGAPIHCIIINNNRPHAIFHMCKILRNMHTCMQSRSRLVNIATTNTFGCWHVCLCARQLFGKITNGSVDWTSASNRFMENNWILCALKMSETNGLTVKRSCWIVFNILIWFNQWAESNQKLSV